MLHNALVSAVTDQNGVKEFFGRVFDLPKRAFEYLGVPDYLIPEFSGPLHIFIGSVLLALLFRPVRYALKGLLRQLIRRYARGLGRGYRKLRS